MLVLLLLGACLSAVSLEAQGPAVPAGLDRIELTLTVEGIQDDAGQVLLALFDTPESFTDEPIASAVLQLIEGVATWRVEVAPGTYAAAAIHDIDANGKMNKNFFGMPREPYGFSNDARGLTGPPSFDDARFEVRAPEVSIRVRVQD